MRTLKKSVLQYCISFSFLSIFQLILIRGVVTSGTVKEVIHELYVDGADFSPILSLFTVGVQSLSFYLIIFSTILYGIFIPLIIMSLIRHFSETIIENDEKKINTKFTFCISIVILLIGCILSSFKLISEVFVMYIPVPIISWIVFHAKKKQK